MCTNITNKIEDVNIERHEKINNVSDFAYKLAALFIYLVDQSNFNTSTVALT